MFMAGSGAIHGAFLGSTEREYLSGRGSYGSSSMISGIANDSSLATFGSSDTSDMVTESSSAAGLEAQTAGAVPRTRSSRPFAMLTGTGRGSLPSALC